mgnify:CR=1 FL=1
MARYTVGIDLGTSNTVVAFAAETREPHRVARYLEELAGLYHKWYDNCRVIPLGDAPVDDVHRTRLWLNDATGISNPALAKVLQYKQQTSRNEIMAYRQAGNKIAVMHGNPVFMSSDDMQEFLTSVHVTLYNKPTA